MLKRFDEFGRDLSGGPVTCDARATRLRCATCRAVLSRNPERISMLGAHRHHCINPHGFHYEIGCFRRVENCRDNGANVSRDTWFPGYAWRVQVCARCGAHVGWRFEASSDAFYGLILSRIAED